MKISLIVILLFATFEINGQEAGNILQPGQTGAKCENIAFSGQLTAWGLNQFENPALRQLGGRFIPTLLGDYSLKEKSSIDFEVSLHINGSLNWIGSEYDNSSGAFKPYRVWMRYSDDNWELRGGLQKINFGPAKIFRPLMWFDQMDVRDPLQLTDGVYGLLGKYFFPNNANIWLWSLIGNKNRKGFEFAGSDQWTPEVGGRIETPLGPGEMAFSTHFRKVDLHLLLPEMQEKTDIRENRFGLDGKWDIGPGIWFETSLSAFEKTNLPLARFQHLLNVGTDYTFQIGAGLNVSAEYFRFHAGNKIREDGISANIFGGMISYPVSILDNITAVLFYLEDIQKWFSYASYTRTYDDWKIYFIGFWNPASDMPFYNRQDSRNLFIGKGIQLMVSYNF